MVPTDPLAHGLIKLLRSRDSIVLTKLYANISFTRHRDYIHMDAAPPIAERSNLLCANFSPYLSAAQKAKWATIAPET